MYLNITVTTKKNDYNVKGVVVGSSMLSVKFFYNDNGDIILLLLLLLGLLLVSVKLLCGDSMPSITKIETPIWTNRNTYFLTKNRYSLGINDTWLRFRDQKEIESQDELDQMNYSGIYLLSQKSKLEYVRNCVLVVIGKPNICCIQNLYNYSGDIYKYRVKWFSNSWGNWQTVS